MNPVYGSLSLGTTLIINQFKAKDAWCLCFFLCNFKYKTTTITGYTRSCGTRSEERQKVTESSLHSSLITFLLLTSLVPILRTLVAALMRFSLENHHHLHAENYTCTLDVIAYFMTIDFLSLNVLTGKMFCFLIKWQEVLSYLRTNRIELYQSSMFFA